MRIHKPLSILSLLVMACAAQPSTLDPAGDKGDDDRPYDDERPVAAEDTEACVWVDASRGRGTPELRGDDLVCVFKESPRLVVVRCGNRELHLASEGRDTFRDGDDSIELEPDLESAYGWDLPGCEGAGASDTPADTDGSAASGACAPDYFEADTTELRDNKESLFPGGQYDDVTLCIPRGSATFEPTRFADGTTGHSYTGGVGSVEVRCNGQQVFLHLDEEATTPTGTKRFSDGTSTIDVKFAEPGAATAAVGLTDLPIAICEGV